MIAGLRRRAGSVLAICFLLLAWGAYARYLYVRPIPSEKEAVQIFWADQPTGWSGRRSRTMVRKLSGQREVVNFRLPKPANYHYIRIDPAQTYNEIITFYGITLYGADGQPSAQYRFHGPDARWYCAQCVVDAKYHKGWQFYSAGNDPAIARTDGTAGVLSRVRIDLQVRPVEGITFLRWLLHAY